jgi:hypothetical protein
MFPPSGRPVVGLTGRKPVNGTLGFVFSENNLK